MPQYKWDEAYQAMHIVPGTYAYRSKWACFDCRTSFTRTRPHPYPDEVVCPTCGKASTNMGYLFQAPPKRAIQQWEVMKILAQHRLGYSTQGSVTFLEAFITNHCKATPKQALENIKRFYGKRFGYQPKQRC